MTTLKIKTPMWKNNSVGIADRNFVSEELFVEILYKNSSGQRTFPRSEERPFHINIK
jgi:hypothetical protein